MHLLPVRGVSEEGERGLPSPEARRGVGEVEQTRIGPAYPLALAQASANGYVEFLGSLFSYYRNVRGVQGGPE